LCRGEAESLRQGFQEVINCGVSALPVREVILTTYLFDGYPTALEGFRLWAEIEQTSPQLSENCHYTPDSLELWRKRGQILCRKIYGPQFEALMSKVSVFAPELVDAMIVEGYGKVLSRKALPEWVRELVITGILAFKNRPRQMFSHALGALRVGAGKIQLNDAIESIRDLLPIQSYELALDIKGKAVNSYNMSNRQ